MHRMALIEAKQENVNHMTYLCALALLFSNFRIQIFLTVFEIL